MSGQRGIVGGNILRKQGLVEVAPEQQGEKWYRSHSKSHRVARWGDVLQSYMAATACPLCICAQPKKKASGSASISRTRSLIRSFDDGHARDARIFNFECLINLKKMSIRAVPFKHSFQRNVHHLPLNVVL
jgi:hypothetical protein